MKLKNLKIRIEKRNRHTAETRFDRYFARRVSIYITWILAHTRVSANQITASQLIVGALGCALVATGEKLYIAFGLGLWQLSYILDCVDGEIARFRGSSSLTGAFFDEASHAIFNSMLYAGLAFSIYQAAENRSMLPFLFGFAAVIFVPPYGILYLNDALMRQLKADLRAKSVKFNQNLEKVEINLLSQNSVDALYKKLAYKSGFFFTVVPYNINLITIAFILDLILTLTAAKILPKGMSLLYLSLIYYGLILPLRHLGGLAKSVTQRKADNEYQVLENFALKSRMATENSKKKP